MAHDLLLGKTTRNWASGTLLDASINYRQRTADDAVSNSEAPKLGTSVDTEIQANYRKIVDLVVAKKMPVADRREFGRFLKKWQEFKGDQGRKFTGSDYVALTNFRDQNRLFGKRLAVFSAGGPVVEIASPGSRVADSSPGSVAGPAAHVFKHVVIGVLGVVGALGLARIAEGKR